MKTIPIYFTEEKWERLELEIRQIKQMLAQLLEKSDHESIKDSEILTAKQVALLLCTDLPTIYAKCANRMIPHFKAGKQYRFNRQEIVEWKQHSSKSKEVDVDEYVNQYLQRKVLKG